MSTDMQLLVGAVVVAVIVIAAFALPRPKGAAPARRAGRQFVDAFDELEREAAARHFEQNAGRERVASMGRTLSPPPPPEPPKA